MRNTLIILLLSFAHVVLGQDNFINVYTNIKEYRINEKSNRDKQLKEIKEMLKQHRSDTAYMRGRLRAVRDSMNSSLSRELGKVINVLFPDIIFSDKDNRHYSMSDLRGSDIAIVYNNMYCEPCFYRLDTTLSYIGKKDVKIIALFTNDTQNDQNIERTYSENVLVGFINSDTKDLISLTMGDSFAYYLDSYGSVRFFDRLYFEKNESAWINFLKSEVK